jgi:hypothetical protein
MFHITLDIFSCFNLSHNNNCSVSNNILMTTVSGRNMSTKFHFAFLRCVGDLFYDLSQTILDNLSWLTTNLAECVEVSLLYVEGFLRASLTHFLHNNICNHSNNTSSKQDSTNTSIHGSLKIFSLQIK